jgi:hypothetical protein
MTQLTEHFSLEELTHTDHRELDNTPTTAEKCMIDGKEVTVNAYGNMLRLAVFLEEVKKILGGKPVMINSGFRSLAVNAAVGSKNTSDHRRGCAADIRVPGMTPDQVVRAIIASDLPYQQVIREFDRWTHVAMVTNEGDAPKKSKLIIDKTGTRQFV